VKTCRLLFLLVLCGSFTSQSSAHSRSESYSHWYLQESTVTTEVTAPLREVMLLYELDTYQAEGEPPTPRQLFLQHVEDTIDVDAATTRCQRIGAATLESASGFVRAELRFDCGDQPPETIRFRSLQAADPAHVHYAKLHQGRNIVDEVILTSNADTWSITASANDGGAAASFVSFISVGIRHILSGVDHIAFLIGLLLIAGTFKRAVIAVTGFTLGHSISLAAAVVGYVSANSRLVEAFIGFTVLLVAVEFFVRAHHRQKQIAFALLLLAACTGALAAFGGTVGDRSLFAYAGFGVFAACYLLATANSNEPATARILLPATLSFGLVHGLGFAGFLMDTGFLGDALFAPLLAFNVGVELGQLAIVAALLSVAHLVRNFVPAITAQLVAAGLAGVGVYWFIERSLAGLSF